MTSEASALRIPKPQMALLVLIGLGQAVTLIAVALLLRLIIEGLQAPSGQFAQVSIPILLLAAGLFANSVLRGIAFAVAERLGYRRVQALRMAMYDHLSRMTPQHLLHRSRGALVLRFTGDITMLRTWISRGIAGGIVASIVLVAGCGILAWLDLTMALAMFGAFAAGSALTIWLGPRLRRQTRWVRRKRSLLTSNIDEQIHSLGSVQAFGRTTGETGRLGRQNDSMTETLIREARVRAVLRSVSSGTGWAAVVAGIAVGAYQVELGHASLAVVVTAITTTRFMVGPIRDLGLSYEYWQRAKISRAKIEDFMASRSVAARPDLPDLHVRDGRIAFEGASVRPSAGGLSATVEPGQIVAVMGATGSGKSSLLLAVAGIVKLERGRIDIDGQDIAEHSIATLRKGVGIVSPDLPLMRGTLRRNLTYRRPAASENEIARVVMQWYLDESVGQGTAGLNTWVTEDGRSLSNGQRQRLMLARAFIGNPAILLLDEPATHLDPRGREVLRRVLGRHQGTVLFVTHDPFEAALADRVWTLDNGALVDDVAGATFGSQLAWVNDLTGSENAT